MNQDSVLFFVKLFISAGVIAGASTIAERNPVLGGYITALPFTSILVLAFTYMQTGNASQTSKLGVAVLAALPASVLFFIPFLFYSRLKGPFWLYMAAGIALLYVGYFLQRLIAARLIQ